MWMDVSPSSDAYSEINARELLDESGNALLDDAGVLLIGDSIDVWTDQAGTGETWMDV